MPGGGILPKTADSRPLANARDTLNAAKSSNCGRLTPCPRSLPSVPDFHSLLPKRFMHRPTTSEPLVAGHCSDQDAAGGGGELHCPVEGGLLMYLFAQSSMTSITSRAFVPSIIMCVTPLNFPL